MLGLSCAILLRFLERAVLPRFSLHCDKKPGSGSAVRLKAAPSLPLAAAEKHSEAVIT